MNINCDKIDGAIWRATYHQPDILISWNLLTETEILGIRVTMKAMPNQEVKAFDKNASGLDSSGWPISLMVRLKANIYNKIQKRKNHQNSDREALPEKSKYLLNIKWYENSNTSSL